MKKIKKKKLISVVTPCFNEEENIYDVYEAIKKIRDIHTDYEWEHIFIDNSSIDNSLEILKGIAYKDKTVKVIVNIRDFGHIRSHVYGYLAAKGDAVIAFLCDLQDPPEFLNSMISKWGEGYDVVYAVRRNRKEHLFKRIAYYMFYRVLRFLSDIDIPLDSGDFAVMDKRIVQELNDLPEHNRFIRGIRAWLGFKQIGLEYDRDQRSSGQPKYTNKKLIKLACNGFLSFSTKPLVLATRLGLIVTILSLILLIVALWQKLFLDIDPRGWASLMVAVSFFGGVQLLVLGILGEYLGRVVDEVRGRPNYIVARTLNLGDQSN